MAVSKYLGEILTTAAALAGWLLLTAGIARLLPDNRAVWLLSSGALCLALCGRQLLTTVVNKGLYVLMRD